MNSNNKHFYAFIENEFFSLALQAWHKRYFLLKDSFIDNTSILQMYNSQQDVKTSSVPLLSLELNETVHIGIASESHRFSNVLVLVCNGRAPLLLAADDELAARLGLSLTKLLLNSSLRYWFSFFSNLNKWQVVAVGTWLDCSK